MDWNVCKFGWHWSRLCSFLGGEAVVVMMPPNARPEAQCYATLTRSNEAQRLYYRNHGIGSN